MRYSRIAATATLLLALVAVPTAVATHDSAEALATQAAKPKNPRGPKAIFPLEAFGPKETDNAALMWSEQTLASIRASAFPPTVVSRIMAVVQTSVYDAWAAYDPVAVGTRVGGGLRRPAAERTLANKSEAISYAAYRALSDQIPGQQANITAFMRDMGYDPANTSTDPATPAGVGNLAAAAVLQFRRGDGSNQRGELNGGAPYSDYTGYTPVNTPDEVVDKFRWQPLRVGTTVQKFATPHWGQVTPFALTGPEQFRIPGPNLRKDYKKPLKIVVKHSAKLTDKDKMIAEHWADGPNTELPPGHSAIFANALCRKAGDNLDHDVKMLFIQANAVLDAGIAVWHYKRKHDFVRPITLVRVLMKGEKIKAWGGPGKGTVNMLGEQWSPYISTPGFAEYPSGHSAFTAASFEVFRLLTGSRNLGLGVVIPAGSSKIEPGLTPASNVRLSWRTMQDAADEAGISREYGGIHFIEGDLHSRGLGTAIGQAVVAKAQRYFNGTA